MLRIPKTYCLLSVQAYLQNVQADIDAITDFHDRVDKAVQLWSGKGGSKESKAAFDAIKIDLDTLRSGTFYCCYCETNTAGLATHGANDDDPEHSPIEHIWPKSLYPERAFVWENYLPICWRCNTGHKLDQWAIFDNTTGIFHDVTPPHRAKGTRRTLPLAGSNVFIDPRTEDPLAFLTLDFANFKLKPRKGLSYSDATRAAYTVKVLALNDGPITQARSTGFGNICYELTEYLKRRDPKNPQIEARMRDNFRKLQHPTVWQEMKRQKNHPRFRHIFCSEMQNW
ncbi:hypothetical protein [Armatimonas sp.]|uniref:hypothetical protein n=1 Tax=Armatimonas sp. TaxID=1872638 RepID=UPI0037510386